MKFQESNEGWSLSLEEGTVQLIQIDFRVSLLLSDKSAKSTLIIEQPCSLKKSHEASFLLVPEQTSSLSPILPFFNAKVEKIDIQRTGELTLKFNNGYFLEVMPNAQYEAWQLSCSIGFMLVCIPGGKVELFKENKV